MDLNGTFKPPYMCAPLVRGFQRLWGVLILKQMHFSVCCIYMSVFCRSGWSVRIFGGSYGLGSLIDRAVAGLRVPSHLLLLSFDLGNLPHCAPLQYSRAASMQRPNLFGRLTRQCPSPPELPQQWLRGTGQRPRRSRGCRVRLRPQAEIILCSEWGEFSDIQCQAAKQRGMQCSIDTSVESILLAVLTDMSRAIELNETAGEMNVKMNKGRNIWCHGYEKI